MSIISRIFPPLALCAARSQRLHGCANSASKQLSSKEMEQRPSECVDFVVKQLLLCLHQASLIFTCFAHTGHCAQVQQCRQIRRFRLTSVCVVFIVKGKTFKKKRGCRVLAAKQFSGMILSWLPMGHGPKAILALHTSRGEANWHAFRFLGYYNVLHGLLSRCMLLLHSSFMCRCRLCWSFFLKIVG